MLRDKKIEKILASNQNNPAISEQLLKNCLKSIFDSRRTYGLFTSQFNADLYDNAVHSYAENVFGDRPAYGIVGIAKVIEDVEISQHNYLNDYIQRFFDKDFAKIHKDTQINPDFLPYMTARIDIQLVSNGGDFQIDSVSDEFAKVTKPKWFQRDDKVGYCIHSHSGKLEFLAKSDADGQIILWLRGMDQRYPEDKSKRIPYWIDYVNLAINDKILINKITPVWHDKFFKTVIDVKAGEKVKIKIEWLPHLSDI